MVWVFIHHPEDSLWTTGFYRPGGTFEPDRDYTDKEEAAARVAWLNGCARRDAVEVVVPLCEYCTDEAKWLMPSKDDSGEWVYQLACNSHHEDWWEGEDSWFYPEIVSTGFRLVRQ